MSVYEYLFQDANYFERLMSQFVGMGFYLEIASALVSNALPKFALSAPTTKPKLTKF